MSRISHPKRKIEDTIWAASKRLQNYRSRRRRRKYKKSAGGASEKTETESVKNQMFDSADASDIFLENFDVMCDKKDDEDEEDVELQQILFFSAQFHSGKNLNLGLCSKVQGKQVINTRYSVIYGSISTVNSIREKGESSCTYCEICDDAKPPNTLIRGSSCRHYYCEECIRNYIGEKIDEDIKELKCPVSSCKRILDIESLMPKDFLDRVKDAIRETEVLASPLVIECPFLDCTGVLIDDKKRFLIRACPKCWRIFCVMCRDSWHMGMSCVDYKLQLNNIDRQLSLFLWGLRDDDDEEDDTGKGNSLIKIFL
ncbi:uncharacterized protein LOC107799213 [Nicotiana tabacum]|uniref:RBR-type E3 ubiquitin transferase n=3 Tax=Nicotiana tabacum TaxID=4097 RepID=A0A1S4AME5_TOBAC|nr:PREDICTED: protein ariadne-1-like [Nicotiana tabacum]